MVVSKNWEKMANGKHKPKNQETIRSLELVKHTLRLIEELNPQYWFIENPRAMLRKQDFMPNDKRKTVTYCKYGFNYQKATDIWTNLDSWNPIPICSRNMPCHVRAPRGSKTGVQGYNHLHEDFIRLPNWDGKQRALRGMIPSKLCLEILECIESEDKKR